MDSLETFVGMGGYGLYVWPSYFVSAVVLALLYFRSQRRLKSIEKQMQDADSSMKRQKQSDAVTAERKHHDT